MPLYHETQHGEWFGASLAVLVVIVIVPLRVARVVGEHALSKFIEHIGMLVRVPHELAGIRDSIIQSDRSGGFAAEVHAAGTHLHRYAREVFLVVARVHEAYGYRRNLLDIL